MKKWTIVLVSNEPYINKCLQSIKLIKEIGNWKDDIVLLVSENLYSNIQLNNIAKNNNIILRKVPNRSFKKQMDLWNKQYKHPERNYIMQREFMYNKFLVFDTYFKNWDIIFYLDAGCIINDDLDRFKKSCEPFNCIYAHSDVYPYINKWFLSRQFDIDVFDNLDDKNDFINNYSKNFDEDYFQSTMFIYDTNIIDENTCNTLFNLNDKYPVAIRMDQGILNLYFNCDRKLWKQIPLKDSKGFLYDFCKRPGCKDSDYCMIKRIIN